MCDFTDPYDPSCHAVQNTRKDEETHIRAGKDMSIHRHMLWTPGSLFLRTDRTFGQYYCLILNEELLSQEWTGHVTLSY